MNTPNTTKRPRCRACESLYGNDALLADVLIPSSMMPDTLYPLCYEHARDKGYLYVDGVIDLHAEPLPVCTACSEMIPELEIYYTIHGADYCQHCTPGKLNALTPAEFDAWTDNPG